MGKKKVISVDQKKEKPEKVKISGLKGGEKIKAVEGGPVLKEPEPKKEKAKKKEKKTKKEVKKRSQKYQKAKAKIDASKTYSFPEAVKLVKETSLSKFTGNLEAHITTSQTGELGKVKLPYFKTRAKKVVIADEKIVDQIKKGKIDFDVLLASPKIMPQLVPYARILGPKGLMPNPKNNTLVNDPKKVISQFSEEKLEIKTEKKAPLVHLVLGKLDQPDKELIANLEAVIKTITPNKIKKITLKATMGPGVRLNL